MSILSAKSNNLFSIGNCPECLTFCEQKRRLYEQDPTAMDRDLTPFKEKGVVKVNPNKQLTLVIKEDGQEICEVDIEIVDPLQCLFFITKIDEVKNEKCLYEPCDLSACVLHRLKNVLSQPRKGNQWKKRINLQ